MRAVTLCLFAAAALATSAAAFTLDADPAHAGLGEGLALGEFHRALEAQQTNRTNATAPGNGTNATVAPAMQCNRTAFMAAVRTANATCNGTFDLRQVPRLFSNTDGARGSAQNGTTTAFLRSLCSPACQRAVLAVSNAHRPCINTRGHAEVTAVNALCANQCLEKLQPWATTGNCARRPAAMCNRTAGCRWEAGQCVFAPNATALGPLCDARCFSRYVDVAQQLDPSIDRTRAQLTYSGLCARRAGAFCYPKVRVLPRGLDMRLAATPAGNVSDMQFSMALATACVDAACYQAVWTPTLGAAVRRAQATFRACAARFVNASNATYERDVRARCLAPLVSEVERQNELQASVTSMCTRNRGRDWCAVHARAILGHRCHREIAGRNGTCSAACAAWAKNATDKAGCCLPTVELVNPARSRQVSATQIPAVARQNGTTRFSANTSLLAATSVARSVTFANYTRCAGLGNALFSARAVSRCVRLSRPAPLKRFVLRGVRWSALASDATLRQRVVDAVSSDIATALGVPVTDVVNQTLKEDTSTTVSRRQSRSGVAMEFQIDASDDAAATAASSSFDTLSASGFSTPVLSDFLTSDCVNCVDPTVDLFANQSAATTTTAIPTTVTTRPAVTTPTPRPNTTAPATTATPAVSLEASGSAAMTAAAAVAVAALSAFVCL